MMDALNSLSHNSNICIVLVSVSAERLFSLIVDFPASWSGKWFLFVS